MDDHQQLGPDISIPTVNPGSPSSLGALLVEENAMTTIHPNALLPSFLERIFMEEATRASQQGITLGIRLIQHYLMNASIQQQQRQQQQERQHNNNNYNNVSSFRRIIVMLRKWRFQIIRWCCTFIRNYANEIRALIIYELERYCLLHHQATLAESLYGGRRAQLGKATMTSNVDDKNNIGKHNFEQQPQKRQRQLRKPDPKTMIRLALWLALSPYLAERCTKYFYHCQQQEWANHNSDDSCDGHKDDSNDHYDSRNNAAATSWWKRLYRYINAVSKLSIQRWYINIFPLVSSTCQLCSVWYQWQYLLGRSVFFDPTSHILQLVVLASKNISQYSAPAAAQLDSSKSTEKPTTLTAATTTATTSVASKNTSSQASDCQIHHQQHNQVSSSPSSETSSPTSIPIAATWMLSSVVVVGFLSQWRSEWNRRQQQQQQGEQRQQQSTAMNHASKTCVPPPPPTLAMRTAHTKRQGKLETTRKNCCPICHFPQRHPTTYWSASSMSSGQVYCYKCLTMYLHEKMKTTTTTTGKAIATRDADNVDDTDGNNLIRLYPSFHPPSNKS